MSGISWMMLLTAVLIFWQSSHVVLCKNANTITHNVEKEDIGTAVFLKRELLDSERVYWTVRFSFLMPPQKFAKLSREKKVSMTARALKYAGGCRGNANDKTAIVECTNAVRKDPDSFASEYPCSYQDWRHEVAERNLRELQSGTDVQHLAQLHTNDQARMNTMTHTGSDGSDLQTRADRVDLPWGAVGENVAAGFDNAKAVVMAWMCSPPHRKNIMSCDFSRLGVGTGTAPDGRMFYTQVFYCHISETCGCGAKRHATVPMPVAADYGHSSHDHGSGYHSVHQPQPPPPGSGHHSAPLQPPAGSHCDWINSKWTCGENVDKRTNPLDLLDNLPFGQH